MPGAFSCLSPVNRRMLSPSLGQEDGAHLALLGHALGHFLDRAELDDGCGEGR